MNTLILEVHRKKEISLYSHSKNSSGPYFIVPSKWYLSWQKYLKGGPKPSRIFLHTLLDSKGQVKSNLQSKKDYFTVPKKLWEYLKSVYGADNQLQCEKSNIYSSDFFSSYSIPTRTTSPSLSTQRQFKAFKPKQMLIKSRSDKDFHLISPRKNLEFSLKISETTAKSLTNGIIGLANSGCSCYMNATLQCFITISQFFKALLRVKKETPLIRTFKDFYLQVKSGNANSEKFAEALKEDFPLGKQHDMSELIRKVIEIIDKELAPKKKVFECDPWRDYEANHAKIVVNLFSGLTCSKIVCRKCGKKTEKFETFTSIALEVTVSIVKSLEKYLENEAIRDQYFCYICEQVTDIEKQCFFVRGSRILIVQLKRFVALPFARKINMHCIFEFDLELAVLGQEHCKYELKAIGVHSGTNNSGHYTAYCKRNTKWYLFDDLACSEVALEQVKEVQAYVLIYTQKSTK